MTSLAEMSIGDRAQVVEIRGEDAISVRILEMGLTPGVAIKLLGTAPLGDPLEIEVRSYRLSLRKSEAERVVVEVK